MIEVLCECDRCKKDLMAGDRMVSLTLSTDFIEQDFVVQPLEAHTIAAWCPKCVEAGIKEVLDKTLWDTQAMEESRNVWAVPAPKHTGENIVLFRRGH